MNDLLDRMNKDKKILKRVLALEKKMQKKSSLVIVYPDVNDFTFGTCLEKIFQRAKIEHVDFEIIGTTTREPDETRKICTLIIIGDTRFMHFLGDEHFSI